MIRLAGIVKPFLKDLKEAVAEPDSIQIVRFDNGNSSIQYPSPEPLDDHIYNDMVEMAKEKYSSGTRVEFLYIDADGKSHEAEVTIKDVSDYEGPYWENESKFKQTAMADAQIIDMFDEFS